MEHIIDLSHRWHPDMPVVAGDPHYHCQALTTLDDGGYALHQFSAGTHTGTHVDAPAHVIPEGPTIADYPVDWLCGRARVFRIKATPRQRITPEAIQNQLVEYLNTPVPEPVVLFDTGWGSYFNTDPSRYAEHPYLAETLVQLLVDSGIKVLGVDTFSPDPSDSATLADHQILLGAGVAVVENLVNLDQLPDHVMFEAYPLPLGAVDASPVRALARFRHDI